MRLEDRQPGWARKLFYAGAAKCPRELRDLALEHLEDSFDFNISGESFQTDAFISVLGHAPEAVAVAALQREPDNQYDPHAVAVLILTAKSRLFRGEEIVANQIGYVPRERARRVSEYLRLHEAESESTVMVTAWLKHWQNELGEQGFTARLASSGMAELTRCSGVLKSGKPCSSTAAEGLLTCKQHDPEHLAKLAGGPKAPKVTVIGEIRKRSSEVREGDLFLRAAGDEDADGGKQRPLLVTDAKTKKVYECSDTRKHEDWCLEDREILEEDWDCSLQTRVFVSLVGPRGGQYGGTYAPEEEVVLAVTE